MAVPGFVVGAAAETTDEAEEETGTLLGVSGLASKPIKDVGFEAAIVVVEVTGVVALVGDAVTGDEAVELVGGADEAAAAAAAAAADPCSNCFSSAFCK